jgi:5-methylcytosine-specific restriction protein B
MEYRHRLLESEIHSGRLNVREKDFVEDPASLTWFKKHSEKSVSVFKSDGSLIRRNIRISPAKGTGWRFACGGADTFKGCRPGDMVFIKGSEGKLEIIISENSSEQSPLTEPLFEQKPLFEPYISRPPYAIDNLSQCAQETFFDEAKLKRWIRATERKKQAILYGPPGTGKTFIAEKLAQHLVGGDGFSELMQFHPAYSYEDFIQGIRPQSKDGALTYPLVSGRFLEFCEKAKSCQGLCVLIIDEINRANLAQVFGELMYLLEYRNKKIRLAGSGELFCIPENVRIIGTMNTADRSIALVDHALRRRFAFIEIRPNYDVLRQYHEKNETGFKVDGLIETLKRLNKAIADKHYEIGISFFLTENLADELEDIWQMEIEPYLEEHFYDQLEKVDEFRWDKIEQQVRL